jgi:flagellar secretion chaperone FliS
MPATPAHAASAYRTVQVESSVSPLELVVMLYDGALASLGQAHDALQRRDLTTKRRAMSKALSIVGHLQSTLDMENGKEVAEELDRLYLYVTQRLLEANIKGTLEPIEESIRLLTKLRDAWSEVKMTPMPGTQP